jgi:hypothetical protein
VFTASGSSRPRLTGGCPRAEPDSGLASIERIVGLAQHRASR